MLFSKKYDRIPLNKSLQRFCVLPKRPVRRRAELCQTKPFGACSLFSLTFRLTFIFAMGVPFMKEISATQKKIYEYLAERAQNGVPPSIREIGAAVGLKSTSSVQANLLALERAGYIDRDPMLKRSIRVLGPRADAVTQVPLIGTVTAGLPILAVEQIEGYVPYSGTVTRDKSLFALHVKGESMINAGILDGDIVIVEKTPVAENGEIVVALIEDEATVKTFYKENGHFRLQPENDTMSPIFVKEIAILGKVKALVRYFD